MTDWKSTAFIFPGQGSQSVGMGKDFFETFSVARHTFKEADDLLGYSLSNLCFNGPSEILNQTFYTQPAIFVCSIAMLRVLRQHLPQVEPSALAGHSLGEITALYAADTISFEEGVQFVQARSQRMKEAGEQNPGSMAAVIGLDTEYIHTICEAVSIETGAPVVIANDNCPGQVVVSGHVNAVEAAIAKLRKVGARRVVKLDISIASHSPLMAISSTPFSQDIAKITLKQPATSVYSNITVNPFASVEEILSELQNQLTHPVRWREVVEAMITDGMQTFVEIGNGDILSGLIKRIDRKVERVTINNVNMLLNWLAIHKK